MSDRHRWRYGDATPVMAAVDSTTVIEIGDLLFQGPRLDWNMSGKSAWPASELAALYQTINREVGMMQKEFADNFLGVAIQRSRSGETDPIRVTTMGVFEFDCPSGTFELGDLVGVRCITTLRRGDSERPAHAVETLANQEVASVQFCSIPGCAIARVAKRVVVPATSVLVDIRSTVMAGGIVGR